MVKQPWKMKSLPSAGKRDKKKKKRKEERKTGEKKDEEREKLEKIWDNQQIHGRWRRRVCRAAKGSEKSGTAE